MKFIDGNYKERLVKFIFERNWIELPLFWNNKDEEVMRLDFESKFETQCANTIRAIFDAVFYRDSEMFVVFYSTKCTKGFADRNKYFKRCHMRKVFEQCYESKDDDIDSSVDRPYITVYKTNRKYFNLDRYMVDYFSDNQGVNMSIISLKKGTAIQMYDCRGMDLVVNDAKFLRILKKEYSEYLMTKDK